MARRFSQETPIATPGDLSPSFVVYSFKTAAPSLTKANASECALWLFKGSVGVKSNKSARPRELDELIDSGIRRIRATWNKLGSIQLRAGPYGKQYLLQQIYSVYC